MNYNQKIEKMEQLQKDFIKNIDNIFLNLLEKDLCIQFQNKSKTAFDHKYNEEIFFKKFSIEKFISKNWSAINKLNKEILKITKKFQNQGLDAPVLKNFSVLIADDVIELYFIGMLAKLCSK